MKKTILTCAVFIAAIYNAAAQIPEAVPVPEALVQPTAMHILNGKMLFVAQSPTYGKELFITNGTLGGTTLLKDINHDLEQPLFGAFTYFNSKDAEGYFGIYNNKMYFQAQDVYSGPSRMYVTDGTTEGTVKFDTGNTLQNIRWYKEYNGRLYFTAASATGGIELWSTDGTWAGTTMLKDINPGTGSAFLSNCNPNFFIFNDKLWFKANDGSHGIELWNTDGTAAGTAIFKDINPGYYLNTQLNDAFKYLDKYNDGAVIIHEGYFYFSAFDGSTNSGGYKNFFKSDGTTAGTVNIDAPVIQSGDTPKYYGAGSITLFNNNIYFFANTVSFEGGTMGGLWKLNTASNEINHVYTVYGFGDNGLSDELPKGCLREYNGNLYFAGEDEGEYHLWKTDGTAAGTQKIFQLSNNVDSFDPQQYTRSLVFNNKLYFVAGGFANENVYASDGTTAGTTALFAENMIFGPQQLTVYGQQIAGRDNDTPYEAMYFSATPNAAYELYRVSNGGTMATQSDFGNKATVYPNPSAGNITINIANPLKNAGIAVSNLAGQLIYEKHDVSGTSINIDLSDNAPGIYFVNIKDAGQSFTQKMIIK